jgi:hypothetical protein
MPYRLNPKNKKQVQVKKEGKWKLVKEHLSENHATRHLRALQLNVKEK